jgi:hypothetical protein
MRQLKITEEDRSSVAALAAVVKQAVRRDAEAGDPTKRGG